MKTFDLPSSFRLKANLLEKSLKVDWNFKRIILHIIWGAINILGLAYILTLFIDSDWGLIFLIFVLIYCSLYWLITTILIDLLIGDEIDNRLKQP
jgi:hypothetical protein